MVNALKITVFALIVAAAGLFASPVAEALLAKHNCTFCHSLHGAPTGGGTTSLVTRGPTNIEVLCLGCHVSPADGRTYGTDTDAVLTAAVQPHKMDGTGSYAEFHVTCTDCHEIHDNMPNWRGSHTDAGTSGTPGTNQKMIGTYDPEGTTPYAVIRTREKDFDRNGKPDRGTITQTCNATLVNDCYTTERRYVIFEQAVPNNSLHAWADNDEDGLDPINIGDGGPGPTDPTVIRSNESDSGALTGGSNKNWSAFDSICQMCHTQTAPNHNLLTGGGVTHNSGRACTDCHLHETCFDRGSCSTVAQTATRDLQVILASALPAAVTVGNTVTISVDVTNLGSRYEAFDVRYFSDIEGYLGVSRVALAASGTTPASLGWVTATAGLHNIKVDIEPVIHETVIDNNYDMVTVSVSPPSDHDVAVTSVSAPGVVLQGDLATVSADIANLGTFDETFNVVLYDNTDDPGHASPIGTLSSGLLAPSGIATLNFSWNTTGASLGSHTLEAVAATVTGETNTANNSATTTSTVSLPTHDVAVDSVTAPASTPQGNIAAVDVVVSNPGTFTETFNVTLSSNLDGAIQTLSSGALVAGGSTTLNFSWDTSILPSTIATHTLTATAATVTGETNTVNNSASTTAAVAPAGPVNDVAVLSVTASPNPVGPTTGGGDVVTFTVIVENQGTVSETIDVTVDSDLVGATVCSVTGVNLGAGVTSTTEFVCTWTARSKNHAGTHLITATAATVPGETDTADNTATTTLVVNP